MKNENENYRLYIDSFASGPVYELSNTRARSPIGLMSSFSFKIQIVPKLGYKPRNSGVTGTTCGPKSDALAFQKKSLPNLVTKKGIT
jgi:hypothetical protein